MGLLPVVTGLHSRKPVASVHVYSTRILTCTVSIFSIISYYSANIYQNVQAEVPTCKFLLEILFRII